MKLKILAIPVVNLFINIFKYIWFPLIINYRDIAREVVYNYWLQNKIAYRLPNDVELMLGMDTKIIEVYKNDKFCINSIRVSKLKYYLYFYLVWIWLDDTLSSDIINNKIAIEILEEPYLAKKYSTELNNLCRIGKGPAFNSFNIFNRNKLNVSIGLLYLSLLYNDNNNFKNIFYYNKYKCTLLGIGFKKEENINGTTMYKWSL